MRSRLIWGTWVATVLGSFVVMERHSMHCRCYEPLSETLSWALGTAPPRPYRYATVAGFGGAWLWVTYHLATYTLATEHHHARTRTHPHSSRRHPAVPLEL